MVAVRNQGRAVDLAPDADAEHGHGLVAKEADHARSSNPADQRDRLRVDQAVDRLIAGEKRAEEDDADDGNASQILDTPETVSESLARLAPGQDERDPQRNRSYCLTSPSAGD